MAQNSCVACVAAAGSTLELKMGIDGWPLATLCCAWVVGVGLVLSACKLGGMQDWQSSFLSIANLSKQDWQSSFLSIANVSKQAQSSFLSIANVSKQACTAKNMSQMQHATFDRMLWARRGRAPLFGRVFFFARAHSMYYYQTKAANMLVGKHGKVVLYVLA
jgi:hypothetical protein